MSDILCFVGGSGDQSLATIWPGFCLRSYFVANGVAAIVFTDGAPIATEISPAAASVAGGTVTFTDTGAFPNPGVLNITDVFIRVITSDGATGLFEISAHNSTAEIEFSAVALDGVATVLDGDAITVYSIGGAGKESGTSLGIEVANDEIGNLITETLHSVEVLTNLDETASAAQALDSDGNILHPLVFTGTIHDASVVANNFVRATDVTDKPVLTMGVDHTLTLSGSMERFRNISVTGDASGNVFTISGDSNIIEQCRVEQTGSGAFDDAAIGNVGGDGTIIRNNHVISVSSQATKQAAAIYSTNRSQIINNFVQSAQIGIYAETGNHTQIVTGNMCDGNNTNSGIEIAGGSATRGVYCAHNSIHNYTIGIELTTMPDGTELGIINILNNVIWLGTGGTEIGISNTNAATSIFCYIDNNAIGGPDINTAYQFGVLIIENKITLTANPFLNAGGSFLLASDFILNTNANGGTLCTSTARPTDFDNNGVQDSWQDVGASQLVPPAGGGGSVNKLTGLIQ